MLGTERQPGRVGAGLERRGRSAFLFLGFIPVVLTAILLWAVQQYRSDATWVDHTHDVLAAIAEVDRDVTRAESAARAYFANHDASRIGEFNAIGAETRNEVSKLQGLVSDNPTQVKRAGELNEWIEKRLAYLHTNIELTQQGYSMDAIIGMRGTEGQHLVAALGSLFTAFRQDEERLLADRVAARRFTNWVLIALCLAAMLVSVGVALRGDHTIRSYRDLRDRAEEQLRNANEQLENRVKERTRELERSNEDLRQFAFAASHDLNEPLRTVGIYTDMLRKRYLSKLDGDAAQVLTFILRGVERMDGLLSGLRTYMQISTLPAGSAPLLELKSGFDAAMLDLKTALEESGARVECSDLPSARIHPVQARQIFQNLIGNAIKYRSDQPPLIQIFSEAKGREWRVHVRDNGIGIDPQYRAHIFGLFKRLHPADEIPGSGLGLAICRTIVQQCGGEMWVDSELNKGSTFSFSLPRPE